MSKLRVILGAGEFSQRSLASEQPCHEILEEFLSRGHTEIDTALMYGNGKSEQIIGTYLAKGSSRAASAVIETKINPWGSNSYKRDSVLEQASRCLSNLQVESVDLLYLHVPDHSTPIEETLAAIQELYKAGKFKEFGLCNYASWEVANIYHICKRNGWVLPTVYQGMYNPITRTVEGELLPALKHFGLRFYAYNPTACGLLTGKYKYSDLQEPSEDVKDGRFFHSVTWAPLYRDRYWRDSAFRGMELVRETLEEVYGAGKVSMVSATFRWLNHHSAMRPECNDGIIIGGSVLQHFQSNLDACTEGPLDQRVVEAFDKAWELDKPFQTQNYFR